jgi:hypothetical protein
LRNPHIILLDETTSNLDEKMALEIEETLLINLDLTVIMIHASSPFISRRAS